MEDVIKKGIEKGIADNIFPGCVVGYIKDGERKVLSLGRFTYENDSPTIKQDTIFDVASITKSIPTVTSLLTFIDSGEVSLEDSLSKYIREFTNKDEVKMKHLLTYTLDLEIPPSSQLIHKKASEIIDTIFKSKLRNPPGTKHFYTNVSAALIGYVVEKVSGQQLPEFADQYFFRPLKMNRSTFYPLDKFTKDEIAPAEIVDWRGGVVQGEVHDESTYVLQKAGYYLGAAGLFSTVPDLLKFSEMILNGGTIDGRKYLSEEIVREMEKDHLNFTDAHVGLGWELNEPSKMGKYAKEIIGKSGFTGCMIMINPKKKSSLVILSNSVYPKRPMDPEPRNHIRRDIADIVFE